MNAIDSCRALLAAAMQESILSRLLLASLEFAVLALAVGGLVWLGCFKSPRAKALLWMLVLAKPVASLLVGSPVCVLRIEPPVANAISAQPKLERVVEEPVAVNPIAADPAAGEFAIEPSTNAVPDTAGQIAAVPGPEVSSSRFGPRTFNMSRTIVGVWIVGVILFACRALVDRLRLVRLIAASRVPAVELAQRYHKVAATVGTTRTPRLLETDDLESPALAGVVMPVIFVPSWLAREMASAKLDWALKHELMHFKQLDHLANFLRELAQSVFFFHPAAWWVGRKWEEATELACDRAIIASHDESHDYAEQLYQMLLVVRNRRQMRLSAGLFATRTQIGRRIAALLSAHISTPSRLSAMAIAVLVALSILTLSVGVGFAERASEEQKEEKKDSTSTAAVDQPEDGVVVSGRVLDPDGEPLSGAKLRLEYSRVTQPVTQHGPTFTTTSDAAGRFRFDVPKSALANENTGYPLYWTSARIIVTYKGYGFDDLPVPKGDAAHLLKLQLVHDVPIHGRILDIEGRPIAGAKLRVKTVRWTPGENLDSFLEDRREGRSTFRHTRFSRGVVAEGDEPVTGADGRFTLAGMGAERVVWFDVEGPGIEYGSLEVVTRDLQSVVASASGARGQKRLYGAGFEQLAAPARLITGVVRDKASGKPIAGATVHGSTNHVATTDDAGRYQLFGYAKSPQYDLQIFPRDFDPYFRAIVSIPDTLGLSPLEKDIELSSGTIVSGRLTENFSGRPIAGRVEYYPLFPNDYVSKLERVGRPSSAMTIHGDGQFEIPVYPGPGVLAFKADGIDDADYAPAFISAAELQELYRSTAYRDYEERFLHTAAGGQARSLISQSEYRALVLINPAVDQKSLTKDVAFQRSPRMRGTVFGPDGQYVQGATVLGLPPSVFNAKTLETANFEAQGLNPKRPIQLLFTHDAKNLGGTVLVRGDETEPLTVRLQPLGSATGRLLTQEGEPAANVTIDFGRTGNYGPGIRTAKTDGDGRFRVDGLAVGQKYDAILWRPNGPNAVFIVYREVEVDAGQTKDLGEAKLRTK